MSNMRTKLLPIVAIALVSWTCAGKEIQAKDASKAEAGKVTAHSDGLHGYIGFGATRPPARSEYSAGMGFYSAVWPLVDQPLADFQIGLAGSWITPDNSDNKDKPLAPEGTLARTWRERGPTWGSVFQTVEGGLGYWAGNHFRYGPPKFSMNATPQCYDYEVGSPGWSFFYSNEALPDNRLGIAQLSNRLLIPPDALPFQGNPNGQFLGYTWMALPFTDPTTGDPPTGDQSWTCFLSAANFKGPIAYYIPETWSKIGKLFNYPFIYGRGLDARPGNMGGGAMEINTVPRFDAQDAQGVGLFEDPQAAVPGGRPGKGLPGAGRDLLLEGGPLRRLQGLAERRPGLLRTIRREGRLEVQVDDAAPRATTRPARKSPAWSASSTPRSSRATCGAWSGSTATSAPKVSFPQYFKHVGEERVAVAAADVPAETRLLAQEFKLAGPGRALHLADHRRLEPARARNADRSRSSSPTVPW